MTGPKDGVPANVLGQGSEYPHWEVTAHGAPSPPFQTRIIRTSQHDEHQTAIIHSGLPQPVREAGLRFEVAGKALTFTVPFSPKAGDVCYTASLPPPSPCPSPVIDSRAGAGWPVVSSGIRISSLRTVMAVDLGCPGSSQIRDPRTGSQCPPEATRKVNRDLRTAQWAELCLLTE